jgi:thiamine monophosphate synthase
VSQLVRLLAITDARVPEARMLDAATRIAERLGPRAAVLLRFDRPHQDDLRPTMPREHFALEIARVLRAHGSLVWVARDLELAHGLRADALHGALESAHAFRIRSAPSHSREQLLDVSQRGANAVLVSPIYTVPQKATARGLKALEEAASLFDGQRLALGGVSQAHVLEVARAGATGVAAMRAVWQYPEEMCRAVLDAWTD